MSTVLDRDALESSPLADLHVIANELGVDGFRRLRKADPVDAVLAKQGGVETGIEDAPEEETEKPRPRRSRSRARSADPEVETEEEAETVAEVAEVAESEDGATDEDAPARPRRGRRGGRGRG